MLIEGGYRNLYESLFKVINFMKNRSYEPLLRVTTCRQHSNHTSNTVFDLIDCLSISLSPSQPPIAQGERKGRVCKGGGRGRVGRRGESLSGRICPCCAGYGRSACSTLLTPALLYSGPVSIVYPNHVGCFRPCAQPSTLTNSGRLHPHSKTS